MASIAICPNKAHPDWSKLLDRVGGDERKAYLEYFKNGFEIPIEPKFGYGEPKSIQQIKEALDPFFNKIGVSLKEVTEIKDADGNKIDAVAASDLLHHSVEVVSGLAKIDTLPEEAAHFFVSILKENNSPLYKSMADEITDYDVYKETSQDYKDIYKGNLDKIKDEAIGKLIAQQIVSKFEQTEKAERANRWWNRVLNFLKEKLGLVNKEELEYTIISNDPFSKAADRILGRWSRLDDLNPNVSEGDQEVFYQLRNAKQLEERIRSKFNLIEGKDRSVQLVDDKGNKTEVKNATQEKIAKQLEKYIDTRSETSRAKQEQQKILSGKGHQDFANIIERLVSERDGKISPARVVNTNEQVYSTLEEYAKTFVDNLPADSRIITNQLLYDKKSNSAVRADLLVIHSNNRVDAYDWHFVDYGKKKSPNAFKESLYNTKLGDIRNYLHNNYGVTDFGRIRAIPIDARFSEKGLDLTSIKIGSQDIPNVTKEESYLLPVPLNEEMTGNEKLDRLIQGLLKQKEDIDKSKPSVDLSPQQKGVFNEKKFADLARITKAIRDIQLKQDLRQYVDIGLKTVSDLVSTPVNQYSKESLLKYMETMNFYGKDMLELVKDNVQNFSDEEKQGLSRLVTEAQMWSSDLKAELASRLIATGSEDLLEPQKETGYFSRMFRTISQQDHPIIKEFWNKLILPAKQKTRESVNELNEQIKNAVADVKKILPNKSQGDLFDWMIDKGKNGELKIASKYKPEFYNQLNEARAKIKDGKGRRDAIEFLRNQGTFDEEAYQRDFDNRVETLNFIYRNDVDKDEKISDRIKRFRRDNDNELGLSNPRNPYFKLNEQPQHYSEKYSKINSTPELKKFYDLWMENSKKFQEYIGQRELGGRFLWNVRNDLVDSLMENGFGAFTNMSSILDHLEAKSSDTLGMVDPNTGLPTYEIPAYYTQPNLVEKNGEWIHDTKNQSKDLGKVLSLVSAMAYNHKYISDIEADSKALGMLLESQQSVLTDSNGNPIKNKLTGQVQKVVGSANTLEQFKDYMNYYVYGVRNKTKDFVIKAGDRNFSSLAVISGVSKWFVGKTLIGNPTSIMAHAVRSHLNVRMLAGMDRFFGQSDYNKSLTKIATRDNKSMQLLAYFDLMHGQNFKKKADELSTSFLSQHLTYDNMFIGHTKTDSNVRNAILLSLLHSHTYDESLGRIVKKTDEQESLLNQIKTEGKNLNLGNIPKEQLEAFRNKALKIGDYALGNNARDDIRLVNLTLMGRALMTFRNWIPNMVYARYGDLRFDEDLQSYELGRYRTFWNNIVSKQFLPIIADGLKRYLTFGYGGRFGDAVINRAKELYAEYMEKNPNAKMTEQEFIDLHLSNMRGNMMEAYILTGLIGGMMAIQPDKDKHEHLEAGSARKWWSYVVNRGFQDISFFYNPVEFNKQIKSPVPMIETYKSLYNFGRAYLHEGEELMGGHPAHKEHEFRAANYQMIPGLAGFEGLMSYLQDDYDKTEK